MQQHQHFSQTPTLLKMLAFSGGNRGLDVAQLRQQIRAQQEQQAYNVQAGTIQQNALMQQAMSNGGAAFFSNYLQVNQDIVISLRVQGTSDSFGCAADCGCTPNVAKIPPQYIVPPAATEYISPTELNDVCQKFNHILEANTIPIMPLMRLHMCLPFSPYCIMSHCGSRKAKKTAEFLATINQEVYLRRNCHWETSGGPSVGGFGSILPPSLLLIKHPAGSVPVAPSLTSAPHAGNATAVGGGGAAEPAGSIPTGWNYHSTGTQPRVF